MATQEASSVFDTSKLPNASKLSFGIVTSEWNEEITGALLKGCLQVLKDCHVNDHHIVSVEVPGSFELPMGAQVLIDKHKLDAVICIGCVIKGETKHDEYISNAVANGIVNVSINNKVPVIFGVLTPNDFQQALDRAGGKYGNKGCEAAATAIKMAHLASHSQ